MQQFVRTRIAPTPSGYLHLGNVLSFALTAALARQSGARIMLRIDDLDRQRVRTAYVKDIFDTLTYLSIPWDEGPTDYAAYASTYSQVHRLELYHRALAQLRAQGAVFACDCSRSVLQGNHPAGVYTGRCKYRGLPLDGKGYCWRIDTDNIDLPQHMHYFIARKKDGMPAYQLASVVDDRHFGVDLIVRGNDLRDSTMAQRFLANVMGYAQFDGASFVHHALLKTSAGEKLSKSAGATSVYYLRGNGYSSTDIYHMVGEMAGLPQPISTWADLEPLIPVFALPIEP
ncbi:glutamate--tRNA ligase family protein [Parapedobacter sp. 10938]|uniref:glutamate--tRNA ligase family protein n=1 Tax=Parapedobacter flavus TaxID=3110225 RepID=UPI002DBA03FB|nr:glutamate--tRNA ligase family protein [Parapedobacter sp. 10938]MEC3879241.1 glutamate--tRNA ligase family protein [Parapedobacter sp. 10938]